MTFTATGCAPACARAGEGETCSRSCARSACATHDSSSSSGSRTTSLPLDPGHPRIRRRQPDRARPDADLRQLPESDRCHFTPISQFVFGNADYLDWDAADWALARHIQHRNGPHRDPRITDSNAATESPPERWHSRRNIPNRALADLPALIRGSSRSSRASMNTGPSLLAGYVVPPLALLRPAPTPARPRHHFPGSPVIGAHRFPPHRSDGAETVSPVPRTAFRPFHAQYAGGSFSARSWIPDTFHGLHRAQTGSAPSLPSRRTRL